MSKVYKKNSFIRENTNVGGRSNVHDPRVFTHNSVQLVSEILDLPLDFNDEHLLTIISFIL